MSNYQERKNHREDFYVKEVCVNIANQSGIQVYLNREHVPGGVVLTCGETWIDGDQFFIISKSDVPLKVSFRSKSWGYSDSRWADEVDTNEYKLYKLGAACGLTHMRGFDPDNIAYVDVLIERV